MRAPGTATAQARLRATLALLFAIALTVAVGAPPASAVILPAATIDGPGQDIVGFGGVAMADDGTGGAVYLKRAGGVTHVFVARYVGGQWLAPIRVDTEEPFAASWPRIGAADGGELVVTWATAFATQSGVPVDEMLGATLGPGAGGFGPAQLIDPDINEPAGTSPDLAMSSTGYADLVYRVVNDEGPSSRFVREFPLLRPGDVIEEVRVAHFNGERWSPLGAINRDAGVSMRPPSRTNAPVVAVGPTGNGVVVWQEPEINGVARIWARRLFGATLDYVLPATATSLGGVPIVDDADAPSVSLTRLGQAVLAYRQPVGPGSPLAGPRIFLNTLPDGEAASGAEFAGASVADQAVSGGDSANVGPPSVTIDEHRELRLLYDSNGIPRVIEGDDRGLVGALSLGPNFAGSETEAVSVSNPEGGGLSAWPSADAQGAGVAMREDFPSGAAQTALVRGGDGGPVGELAVGRSGLGDGLVGFLQGPLGNAAVVVASASAPPEHFAVNTPKGWIRSSAAAVSWEEAASAKGPLRYTVVVDGKEVPTPAGTFSLRINRHLPSGRHAVQVLATDIDGQATLSSPATLEIEARAPTVRVSRALGGHGVRVRITDRYSGVDTRAVSISFGDGKFARGRTSVTHRYARAGVYRVTVRVRSAAGTAGVVRKTVSVR